MDVIGKSDRSLPGFRAENDFPFSIFEISLAWSGLQVLCLNKKQLKELQF